MNRAQTTLAIASRQSFTIAEVVEGDRSILITFTNGTYVLLMAPSDGSYSCIGEEEWTLDDSGIPPADAVRVGLITQAELDALKREREKTYRALDERRDRAEYLRLKAKFEGT